ncbi:hypothetical protein NVP1081O_028 [Vibrio phage 1.081.O._10N.286.52.C2]|nr:hypothetical protein NVP1081O_028 [Vibrio phage 1.081.O._10N.286.52.C2]
MTEFRRAFRASGLDASGQNVINVADPRVGEFGDGVNLGYFIEKNTVQEYDETRNVYPLDFIVEYNQRLYKNITPISVAEPFDKQKWRNMRTDPEWENVDTSIGANIGDFLFLTATAEIDITLPENPVTGDTVTLMDGRGVLSTYPATIVATGGLSIREYDITGSVTSSGSLLFNRPASTLYLVFNGIAWTFQLHQDVYETYLDDGHSSQQGSYISNGGYNASVGEIITFDGTAKPFAISMPLVPRVGDSFTINDAMFLTDKTTVYLRTNPLSVNQKIRHPFTGADLDDLSLDNIGSGEFILIDDGGVLVWILRVSSNPHLINTIGSSSSIFVKSRKRYAIEIDSAISSLTITLPVKPVAGDWIDFSNELTADKDVTIRVHPDFGDDDTGAGADEYKILMNLSDLRMNKYSVYAAQTDEFNDSITIAGDDTAYSFGLVYDGDRKVWSFVNVSSRIDIADETHRKRPGIVPLASPTEALAHGIEYAHAEDAGQSWANQNPLKDNVITVETLDARRANETQVGMARTATTAEVQLGTSGAHRDDLIVTPATLNDRTATETRRGVAEIATQTETRSLTLDTHIVTPKKFHAAQAEEDLTGVGKLTKASNNIAADGTVSSTDNMRTDRTLNGVNDTVYDADDHLRFVTPKMLDEYRATEDQPGTLWVAKSTELRVNDSTVDDAIITPMKLAAWKASSSIRGISRHATQTETNAITGTGESWNNVFVTPETLHNRSAQEGRRGVAEIATQTETDAGTDDTRILTPAKFETWLSYDHFTSDGVAAGDGWSTDGIAHTGDIWSGVDFKIAVATETQRGTLEVATQAEANANTGGSDIHIITPAKLNARRATETLAGIAEIATSAEINDGTSTDTIVTPATLQHWTRYASNSRASEALYGTVQNSSAADTWVGNSTVGSTQAYTEYERNTYAVTPYGLNYALRNYLPLNAKADDSDLLDGLDSTQFARRDIAQNINGTYSFRNAENVRMYSSDNANYWQLSNANTNDMFIRNYGVDAKFRIYSGSDDTFVVQTHGATDLYHNKVLKMSTQETGVQVTGAIVENESSANGASPGTGSLRTKYLGISNNAVSASKWATARTLTLAGDVSGSTSIDGTANKTITVTVADNSHNHTGENITSGTVNNDRLRKASRSNQGIVQVTSDVRTSDPVNLGDPHSALSAGAGKVLSERIDLFTPDGGTGESVKYRDYIQVGTVRMSTSNQGVMEFTFGHAI